MPESTPVTPAGNGDELELDALRAQAASCTACPLYRDATQTVFGAGAPDAELMLVGEVPGDREDLDGHPFVGPAGQLLRQAIGEAGISAASVYMTNAVKHFKFEERGKRRLHKRPNRTEMSACRPWLEAELAAVHPRVVVALGVLAATSLSGRPAVISKLRGREVNWSGPGVLLVTVHPSAVLRTPRGHEFDTAFAGLVADLRMARTRLTTASPVTSPDQTDGWVSPWVGGSRHLRRLGARRWSDGRA
jgi:DNA polymerase